MLYVLLTALIVDDKQLELVLAKHIAARQQISQCYCKWSMQSDAARSMFNIHGEFRKNMNDYRLTAHRRDKNGDPYVESIRRDGNAFDLKQGRQSNYHLFKLARHPYQEIGNPFWFCLMYIQGPSIGPYPLEELLKNPKCKVEYFKEIIGDQGNKLYSLKIVYDICTIDLKLNPKFNCLVQYADFGNTTAKITSKYRITSFSEPEPGVFFPVESVCQNERDGKIIETFSIKITDFSLHSNKAKDIAILFPTGTRMTDSIKNESYQVDANGNRIGAITSYNKVDTPSATASDTVQGGKTAPEIAPTFGWNIWLILAGFILVATALLTKYYRGRSSD